jgi:cytochrome c oxidase subunit 2
MALCCLTGLLVAGRAADADADADADATFSAIGLIFSLASVLTIFNLIRVAFDEAEGKVARRDQVMPYTLIAVACGSVLFHILSPWWWAPIASNWHYADKTINLTFWITGFVFMAVLVFLAYCLLRFRHRKGHRAEYEPESTQLEVVLAAGTALGIAVMLAPGLIMRNQFITVPTGTVEVEAMGQQ